MASTTVLATTTAAAGSKSMETTFEVHEMRITNHGKISAWVEFALQFFEASAVQTHICVILPDVTGERG